MHTVSGANIHFHRPDECSVDFQAIEVPGESRADQEIAFFVFYALYQLARLSPQASHELANALGQMSNFMPAVVQPTGAEPVRFVPHAPARRTFEARLQFDQKAIQFNVTAHGFGWLSWGREADFAQLSVTCLLRWFALHRRQDGTYLADLAMAAELCAEAFATGVLRPDRVVPIALTITKTLKSQASAPEDVSANPSLQRTPPG